MSPKSRYPVEVFLSWESEARTLRETVNNYMTASVCLFSGAALSFFYSKLLGCTLFGLSLAPVAPMLPHKRRLEMLEDSLRRCEVHEIESRKERYINMLGSDAEPAKTIEATIEATAESIELPPAIMPLDLRSLSFHHLMLLGPTGFGKSTLASYLLDHIEGDIVVIDPHATPKTWGDLPVVGMGRDYASVEQFIEVLLKEMNDRYERRMRGDESYKTLNIVVDEFPSVAKKTDPEKFKDWSQTMLCEARKVQMKLLLLSQGKSVKTIGLEGQSELLENLTIIRGGGFAMSHARSLKDDVLVDWLKQQERPAMANDEALENLDLSAYKPRLNVKPSKDLMKLLPGYKLPPSEVNQQLQSELLEKTVTEPENAVTIDITGLQQSYGVTDEQVNRAITAIRNGTQSDSKIIKEILGMQGRNYSNGKDLLCLLKEVIVDEL